MRDLDTLLLDRVFQPAANAFADWVDCFGLSRICLFAAIGAQTAILAWCLSHMPDAGRIAMVTLGTMAEYVAAQMLLAQLRRLRRQTRPGMMNIARITHRPLRMLWVAFAISTLVFWGMSQFQLIDCLNFAVGLFWLLTVYFMGCAAQPPRQRFTVGRHAFAGA